MCDPLNSVLALVLCAYACWSDSGRWPVLEHPPGSLSSAPNSERLLNYWHKDLASCPCCVMCFLCGQVVSWHGTRALCSCSWDLDPPRSSLEASSLLCAQATAFLLVSFVREEKTEQAKTHLSSGSPCEGHRRHRCLADVCSELGWDWRWYPRAMITVLTALTGLPASFL